MSLMTIDPALNQILQGPSVIGALHDSEWPEFQDHSSGPSLLLPAVAVDRSQFDDCYVCLGNHSLRFGAGGEPSRSNRSRYAASAS
jgi:hypothetical protein